MPRELLELFVPGFAFAFGAVVGSFLNAVIHRLPREDEGLSLLEPKRSFCPKCSAQIAWYDNLPLASYLLLGGRCRACKAKIPLRYFGVELLTALLFTWTAVDLVSTPALAGADPHFALLGVHLALVASMVAVTFIDFEHHIIPDRIDKPGMVLALVLSPFVTTLHVPNGDLEVLARFVRFLGLSVPAGFGIEARWLVSLISSALGMVTGAGVIYAIGVLGTKLFKKDAMGFGDVKYMGMLGGFLGWQGVLMTLFLACMTGAFIGIAIKLVTKDEHIPFGPFLSLGALLMLRLGAEVYWALFVWYPSLIRG